MEAILTHFSPDHRNGKDSTILQLVVEAYHPHAAVVLYTDAKYKISMILNIAIKSGDLNALYNLRAYVHDLSNQLRFNEDIQLKPKDAVFRLYHGRDMPEFDIKRLMAFPRGSIICFSGYLSTSKKEDVAKRYANAVLLDITYEPARLRSVHAADISEKSMHPSEEEVLFNLNSVFELDHIEDDMNADHHPKRIIRVFLIATDKGSENLTKYLEIQKNERPENQSTTVARLLITMGEYSKALVHCERMLKQLNVDSVRPRPLEAADIYNVIAIANCNSSENMDNVEKILKIALDIEQEHNLGDHVFASETLKSFGTVHERRNNWAQSLDYYEMALGMYQRLARPNNPSDMARIASIYNNIGIVYDITHDYKRAKQNYKMAENTYKSAFNIDEKAYHHALAEVLSNLACVYDVEGDYKESQKLNEQILNIYKNTLGGNHLHVGKSHINCGCTLHCLGQFIDAIFQFEEALNIYEHIDMRPKLSIATTWSNIGESYRVLGQNEIAIEHIARGFHLRLSLHKQNSEKIIDVATSYKLMANFYMEAEELHLADIYARHALKTFRNSEGSDQDPDIASTYNILGEIFRRRHKLQQSINHHETAFMILSRKLPQYHVMIADCYYMGAWTYFDQINYRRALLYCIYAKFIYIKCTPNHPNLSEILFLMALIYESIGDYVLMGKYDLLALEHAKLCRKNMNPRLLALYYRKYATILYRRREYREAFECWGKARALPRHVIKRRRGRCMSFVNFYLVLPRPVKRRDSV